MHQPTLQHPARAALLALLGMAAASPLTPALAAGAMARASAVVVEAVPVNAWLGNPVSVQDLLLALNAPAGPGTGALVPRLVVTAPPTAWRLLPGWIAGALDARAAFGIDSVPAPAAALLPPGLAASVSAFSATTGGDGDAPLVITVAFN